MTTDGAAEPLNFYVSSLQGPTAVHDACYANFFGPTAPNLILKYSHE
jgi:hypothetical protein